MSTPLQFATDLALATGKFLAQSFSLFGHPVSLKADRSVVTQADLQADQLIRSQIQQAYPGEQLLSEEHEQGLEDFSSPLWIIDPLDGTTNFSLGLPIWGVLITRIVNGYPDTAVCYFPLLNELYTAQRHQGAFLNSTPIRAHPPEKEQAASFFSCCSRTYRRYKVSVPYKPRMLGSGGYTFCAVARAAAILGFEATPKIWDLAAAYLIVSEAGGIIEPYHAPAPFPVLPGQNYYTSSYPTLAAATPEMIAFGREHILAK